MLAVYNEQDTPILQLLGLNSGSSVGVLEKQPIGMFGGAKTSYHMTKCCNLIGAGWGVNVT